MAQEVKLRLLESLDYGRLLSSQQIPDSFFLNFQFHTEEKDKDSPF